MLVKDIVEIMEQLAPPHLAEKWDNVGLLVGEENAEVKKILFALDAIDSVVDEAISIGADMIITHHPLIFKGVNSVSSKTALGRRIIRLVKNNIAVYSAHTNFDIADGGTNSILAQLFGLQTVEGLVPSGEAFLGKVGNLEKPVSLAEFAEITAKLINAPAVNIAGEKDKIVKRVGICTGSGADRDFMLMAKKLGCDVYVTGDVSYHNAQFAEEIDLCLVDATHYYTEAVAIPYLCDYVQKKCNAECVVTAVKGNSMWLCAEV